MNLFQYKINVKKQGFYGVMDNAADFLPTNINVLRQIIMVLLISDAQFKIQLNDI
jgi:hypothetical protein